jgi:hypothetical protein
MNTRTLLEQTWLFLPDSHDGPTLPKGQKLRLLDSWCRKTGLRPDGTAPLHMEERASLFRARFQKEGINLMEYMDKGSMDLVEVIGGQHDGMTGEVNAAHGPFYEEEIPAE